MRRRTHSLLLQRKRSDPPTEQASTTGQKHKQLQRVKNSHGQAKLDAPSARPVNRTTTGQLPDVLAELSEEALQLHGDDSAHAAAVLASGAATKHRECSYDGDDAE